MVPTHNVYTIVYFVVCFIRLSYYGSSIPEMNILFFPQAHAKPISERSMDNTDTIMAGCVENKSVPVSRKVSEHPAWARLCEQISWYDSRSIRCQRLYKWLRFLQIALAVTIPVMAHLQPIAAVWVVSIEGALIAIFEGLQHMNQYPILWITYRSTAERLKHEKYLFLSIAGPYKDLNENSRLILLAERVEEHVSTEHANWFDETRYSAAYPKHGVK
jgi:hypothetical protein